MPRFGRRPPAARRRLGGPSRGGRGIHAFGVSSRASCPRPASCRRRDGSACMPPPGSLPHPGLLPSVALRSRAPRRGLRHPCLRESSPASCRRGRFRALRSGWHRATAGDLWRASVPACLPAATSAAPAWRASMPGAGDGILPSRSAASPPMDPSVVPRAVPSGSRPQSSVAGILPVVRRHPCRRGYRPWRANNAIALRVSTDKPSHASTISRSDSSSRTTNPSRIASLSWAVCIAGIATAPPSALHRVETSVSPVYSPGVPVLPGEPFWTVASRDCPPVNAEGRCTRIGLFVFIPVFAALSGPRALTDRFLKSARERPGKPSFQLAARL